MTEAEGKHKPSSTYDDEQVHVVLFPGPVKGNVNSMLKLAQLLALHNIHVTFINTEFIHDLLKSFGDVEALSQTYPTLRFKTIPDGLPRHHPRSGDHFLVELYSSMNSNAKPLLRDILILSKPKVTCLVADGFLAGLTADVADEVRVPLIHFRAISVSCFWAFFCAPILFRSNQLPIRGEEGMDNIVTTIPGMENLIRFRDLPSFFRGTESNLVELLKLLQISRTKEKKLSNLVKEKLEESRKA